MSVVTEWICHVVTVGRGTSVMQHYKMGSELAVTSIHRDSLKVVKDVCSVAGFPIGPVLSREEWFFEIQDGVCFRSKGSSRGGPSGQVIFVGVSNVCCLGIDVSGFLETPIMS